MLCAGETDIGNKDKWVKTDMSDAQIPGVAGKSSTSHLCVLLQHVTLILVFSEQLYYLGSKVDVLAQLSLGNGLWSGVCSIFFFDS